MDGTKRLFPINPLIRLYTIIIYTYILLFTYFLKSLFPLFPWVQYGTRSQCLCGFEGSQEVEQEAKKVEQRDTALTR